MEPEKALHIVFNMAIKNWGGLQMAVGMREGISTQPAAAVLYGTDGSTPIDFRRINGLVAQEQGAMLQSNPDVLRNSYEQGLAAVLRIDGEDVGYARLVPLLNDAMRERLGLPRTGMNIWELGTVVISPEWRGNGYSELLTAPLLACGDGNNLIISTTKSLALANSLVALSMEQGLSYRFPDYSAFPAIQALTCVCTPPLGGGVQHGGHCDLRVTSGDRHLPILNDPSRRDEISQDSNDKLGCCVLYVSDSELASRLNAELMHDYGSQQNLINELRAIRHYSRHYS